MNKKNLQNPQNIDKPQTWDPYAILLTDNVSIVILVGYELVPPTCAKCQSQFFVLFMSFACLLLIILFFDSYPPFNISCDTGSLHPLLFFTVHDCMVLKIALCIPLYRVILCLLCLPYWFVNHEIVNFRLERKTVKRKRVFATLKVLGTVLEQLTKEIPDEVGYVLLCIFLIFVGMQTFNSSLAMFFLYFFLFEYMWDIKSRKWKSGITYLLY